MSADLDSLVQQTERKIVETIETSQKRARYRSGNHFTRNGFSLALLAIIAYSTWTTVNNLTPMTQLSNDAVQSNMLSILNQARISIESNRDADGRPPAVLPNASLARVIYYQVADKDYELTLFLNNNTARLDYDGNYSLNGEKIDAQ